SPTAVQLRLVGADVRGSNEAAMPHWGTRALPTAVYRQDRPTGLPSFCECLPSRGMPPICGTANACLSREVLPVRGQVSVPLGHRKHDSKGSVITYALRRREPNHQPLLRETPIPFHGRPFTSDREVSALRSTSHRTRRWGQRASASK